MTTGEKLSSILQEIVDQIDHGAAGLPENWRSEMYKQIDETCKEMDNIIIK